MSLSSTSSPFLTSFKSSKPHTDLKDDQQPEKSPYLSDKVALEPGSVGVLPPFGAGHPHPGHIPGEVRAVGRVPEELTVAEPGAVDPGDGEVQVPLPGEVAEEERGGQ